MQKGFTLLELLITIVIIAVLATIAVPNFTKMLEKAKADQATTYLRVIRTGEKIYFSSHNSYIPCDDAHEIKDNIGAEITTENYTFKVEGDPDIEDSFKATATRKTDTSKTITLDEDGDWGGTSPYVPAND